MVGGTELLGVLLCLCVSLLSTSPFPDQLGSLSHPYVLSISLGYEEYNTLQNCLVNRDRKIAHLIKNLSQESLRAWA